MDWQKYLKGDMSQKRGFIVFVFTSLLFFQLIYGFLSPSVGSGEGWLPITSYLKKFSPEGSDNFIVKNILPLISSEYRLNSDVGEYFELAGDFSAENFENRPYLNRPLYPFLIFLISNLVKPFVNLSYGILFGIAILLNFIMIVITVLLFFDLMEKIFSLKIALLSSILLIFSPLVHSFISQPIVEMLTAFMVMVSLYLLYKYVKKPTVLKLVCFSLISGTLILGKLFFAIPLFVLFLAAYFKRYKEGIIFLIVFLIPYGFWYLWVTKAWGIPFYVHEAQHWQMGIWVKNIFYWPWYKNVKILIKAVPSFIGAVVYAFILIPAVFSVIGFGELREKTKKVVYLSLVCSVFSLSFLINHYLFRHAFMLFPVIYPTAVLGIERVANYLKRYNRMYYWLFYLIVIASIIILSSTNIYKVYSYLN